MNININDIKNGMTVIIEGNLCTIVDFQHVKPGKGTPFIKIKLKNLRTGSLVESTFNTNIKIEKARVEKVNAQYLYQDGTNYVFMNTETYDQIELSEKKLEEEKKYLKEQLEINIASYEGELLGITLPEKVEYLVTSTEPAVKGNTSSSAMKDAIIETGYSVKVPLFINEGDTIVISTKDGKYCSRA